MSPPRLAVPVLILFVRRKAISGDIQNYIDYVCSLLPVVPTSELD